MIRSLAVLALVAGISYSLTQLGGAEPGRPSPERVTEIKWVRTVDGWEPSDLLTVAHRPYHNPAIHPGLVAAFQLGASLFVLVAFPSKFEMRKLTADS